MPILTDQEVRKLLPDDVKAFFEQSLFPHVFGPQVVYSLCYKLAEAIKEANQHLDEGIALSYEISKLKDERDALRVMLEQVQWSQDTWGEGGFCPICGTGTNTSSRHAPDCPLAALLKGEGDANRDDT